MIGMEVRDGQGIPCPPLRDRIIESAFRKGLLLLPCGASTVRFCPPLCLTRRQVAIGLQVLDAAMEDALAASRPVPPPATDSPDDLPLAALA
jgi:4-aminobutyrate aminotransferase